MMTISLDYHSWSDTTYGTEECDCQAGLGPSTNDQVSSTPSTGTSSTSTITSTHIFGEPSIKYFQVLVLSCLGKL